MIPSRRDVEAFSRGVRAQVDIGGLGWAFVVFIGLIIMGAIIENMVLGQAVDPLIGYAENQTYSSPQSTEGLRVLKQWRGLFTLIVLVIASMFFIGYAIFISNRRL